MTRVAEAESRCAWQGDCQSSLAIRLTSFVPCSSLLEVGLKVRGLLQDQLLWHITLPCNLLSALPLGFIAKPFGAPGLAISCWPASVRSSLLLANARSAFLLGPLTEALQLIASRGGCSHLTVFGCVSIKHPAFGFHCRDLAPSVVFRVLFYFLTSTGMAPVNPDSH